MQSKSLIDIPYENNLINDTSDNETNDNVQTDSLFGDLRDKTNRVFSRKIVYSHQSKPIPRHTEINI